MLSVRKLNVKKHYVIPYNNMANLCKKVKDWLSYPLYAITYVLKKCVIHYMGYIHRVQWTIEKDLKHPV